VLAKRVDDVFKKFFIFSKTSCPFGEGIINPNQPQPTPTNPNHNNHNDHYHSQANLVQRVQGTAQFRTLTRHFIQDVLTPFKNTRDS
jgi:hypothetical protein